MQVIAGYYSRFAILRSLLLRFLDACASAPPPSGRPQIVVLGAGYDATFFQMTVEGHLGGSTDPIFTEIDFREVTKRKAAIIARNLELQRTLGPTFTADVEKGEVMGDGYRVVPVDLRCLSDLESAMQRVGFDIKAPTYVLAECVLVYMKPDEGMALLRWFGARLECGAIAIYEQISPSDAFGQQMMLNLSLRGCPLLGVMPSLEAYRRRLHEAGWSRAEARTMADLWRNAVNPEDRHRVERIEFLDEFEEWELLQAHYCIALGVKDPGGVLNEIGFKKKL